jgi:hypothetical protein
MYEIYYGDDSKSYKEVRIQVESKIDNYKLLKTLAEILGVKLHEIRGKNKEEILQIIRSNKLKNILGK